MKKLVGATAILLLTSTNAFYAGNLSEFEAPEEVIVDDEPMGGSNAAWIIPLIAIIAIAASSGGNGDGNGVTPGNGATNGNGNGATNGNGNGIIIVTNGA